MAVIRDLVATLHSKSQPPQIVVKGEIETADGAVVTVREIARGETKPLALFLELTVEPAGGKGQFTPFTFSRNLAEEEFTTVTVIAGEDSESADIEVLGV